jgi:hypothetical protein
MVEKGKKPERYKKKKITWLYNVGEGFASSTSKKFKHM